MAKYNPHELLVTMKDTVLETLKQQPNIISVSIEWQSFITDHEIGSVTLLPKITVIKSDE